MGFRNSSFAKIWEVQPKNDRWTKLRLSISHKNKQTDEYEVDFNGWVDCYGTDVATKASRLKEGDRIKLLNVDVTNSYDKEKKVTYWNPKIFDFEIADGASTEPAPAKKSKPASKSARAYEGENDVEDDDYPF